MIYAVLLAFAKIVVWEKFSDAETAVVQEAGASATLFRLAAGPEPEAVATRAALGNYLRLAIDRDYFGRSGFRMFAHRALDRAACAVPQTEETGTRPMGPGDLTGDNCE